LIVWLRVAVFYAKIAIPTVVQFSGDGVPLPARLLRRVVVDGVHSENIPAPEDRGVIVSTITLTNRRPVSIVVAVIADGGVEVITVVFRAHTILIPVGAATDWSHAGGEQKRAHHHEERETQNQSHT
jgi:hypothetical protein